VTPPPHGLKVRKPKEPITARCPTCSRYHRLHPEFGAFCCLSCLQMPIRPLIVVSK
jgi:hypothetical protein